jgi:hypothetical protein
MNVSSSFPGLFGVKDKVIHFLLSKFDHPTLTKDLKVFCDCTIEKYP